MSDTGETGITFYMRDLTDMDALMRTAKAKHVALAHGPSKCAFVVGARDGVRTMGWHGMIDEVKLSNTALPKQQLFVGDIINKSAASGHWKFEENPGFFKDSDSLHPDLLPAALSHGVGSETQRPFAVVIVGGIVSATLFTLLLLPLAFAVLANERK